MKVQVEDYGEGDHKLGKISPVYHIKSFCNSLIASMKGTTTYWDDIDDHSSGKHKASGVISKDWHMRLTIEEVARLFNMGIDMAKRTLEVTRQMGIRTAIHPMMRQL